MNIQSRNIKKTRAASTANISPDMSASSASPTLRRTVKKRTKVQKVQETVIRLPMSTGKVSLIASYFEKEDKELQDDEHYD